MYLGWTDWRYIKYWFDVTYWFTDTDGLLSINFDLTSVEEVEFHFLDPEYISGVKEVDLILFYWEYGFLAYLHNLHSILIAVFV